MKCTQHSKKYCCCGGHNHSNVKKNKKHNSTKKKLSVKVNRKFKRGVEVERQDNESS